VRSVIPTPAEKQSDPMEIGDKGCHRSGSTSLLQCGGCQPSADSQFAVHLTPPGMVGFDDRTWGKRPFPFKPATPVRRRRTGVLCSGSCVRNFHLPRSYVQSVRRFANQGIGLSLRDRPRESRARGLVLSTRRPGGPLAADAVLEHGTRGEVPSGISQDRDRSTHRPGPGRPAPGLWPTLHRADPAEPRARAGNGSARPDRRS
jgi:hypothetical protein